PRLPCQSFKAKAGSRSRRRSLSVLIADLKIEDEGREPALKLRQGKRGRARGGFCSSRLKLTISTPSVTLPIWPSQLWAGVLARYWVVLPLPNHRLPSQF